MTSRHNALRYCQKFSDVVRLVGLLVPPRERLNCSWGHRTAKDVSASADHGSRAQHCSDARLGMISEERSEELLPSCPDPRGRPHLHRSVGVLEVTGRRHCADVYPSAQVRVPDKSSVAFVAMPDNYRVVEFSADLAMVADGRRRHAIFGQPRLGRRDA